jgi:hypothetical protein
LYELLGHIQRPGGYRFSGLVSADGLLHTYIAVEPEPLPASLPLIFGDSIHNLRSALDHLAWALVLANGGSPDESTYFPVRRTAPDRPKQPSKPWSLGRALVPGGGVTEQAAQLLDELQPYSHTAEGQQLARLHSLDIWDKHRRLAVITEAVAEAMSVKILGDPEAPPDFTGESVPGPLANGMVAARVRYGTPYFQLDAQLRLRVLVALNEPELNIQESLQSVLAPLVLFVEDDLLARFDVCF